MVDTEQMGDVFAAVFCLSSHVVDNGKKPNGTHLGMVRKDFYCKSRELTVSLKTNAHEFTSSTRETVILHGRLWFEYGLRIRFTLKYAPGVDQRVLLMHRVNNVKYI